jgi:hypothetical protein
LILDLRVQFCVALQHGIETLDGSDADAAHRVQCIGCEVLYVIEFGELAAIVWGHILLELV